MTTTPVLTPTIPTAGPGRRTAPSWTAGRIAVVTLASAAVVGGGFLAAAAGGVHLVDQQVRDGDYVTSDSVSVSSAGHAVTVEGIDLDGLSGDWLLGTARLRATAAEGSPVFIGVASTDDLASYLDDVAHSTATELDDTAYDEHPGGAPSEAPADSDIWIAQASGPGTQTMTWEPADGSWTVVVMNQDGSAGVDVGADVGATLPVLPNAVQWLLIASVVFGVGGGLALCLVRVSTRRRSAA